MNGSELKAQPPVILLMGPTASGKTALAVDWASQFPVDLISVDSALVYRGMNIGTAKPDPSTLERAPHQLIDIMDPTEPYSAAQFVADALMCIQRSHDSGRIPVLVGGTMLYFKALIEGLSPLPAADPDVRANIEQMLLSEGKEDVFARLVECDPVTANRLKPSDTQRVQRALEVFYISGRPMSDWHDQEVPSPLLGMAVKSAALLPNDRAVLHQRIAVRLGGMLSSGLVDEVRLLKTIPGLNLESSSMRAVGYRQVWDYLDGRFSYDEMVDKIAAATRQLAKRQLTWLRNWPHAYEKWVMDDQNLFELGRNFVKGLL